MMQIKNQLRDEKREHRQSKLSALPIIIQGGMGVAVSNWALAHAVSQAGQLGVVSGTSLATVLVRRLQQGDRSGKMRHALEHFPFPDVVSDVCGKYFIAGGKASSTPFKLIPLPTLNASAELVKLTVAANFVEVFLAKEGHDGIVGINLLEKIQLPTLPSLYGAMLADVDYVLMGAGIPRAIPSILDRLAIGESCDLKIDVEGAMLGEEFRSVFDPQSICGENIPYLKRPKFLAIVSSATLATALARKSDGRIDGFVVEGETAGGHIAPPRGILQLNDKGEPLYGPRDIPDLDKIRDIGLPFWLAGSYGQPAKLDEALCLGAAGIQVGTAFAFCEESGVSPDIKQRVIKQCRSGNISVFTDPIASPTGFPFKVCQLEGTLSENVLYESRSRVCDLGYLRKAYRKTDGTVGYRCPGEPIADFMQKGGIFADTQGRKCICNALLATIALGQIHPECGQELPLVTVGNDVGQIMQFLKPGFDSYTAMDVLCCLLGGTHSHS